MEEVNTVASRRPWSAVRIKQTDRVISETSSTRSFAVPISFSSPVRTTGAASKNAPTSASDQARPATLAWRQRCRKSRWFRRSVMERRSKYAGSALCAGTVAKSGGRVNRHIIGWNRSVSLVRTFLAVVQQKNAGNLPPAGRLRPSFPSRELARPRRPGGTSHATADTFSALGPIVRVALRRTQTIVRKGMASAERGARFSRSAARFIRCTCYNRLSVRPAVAEVSARAR